MSEEYILSLTINDQGQNNLLVTAHFTEPGKSKVQKDRFECPIRENEPWQSIFQPSIIASVNQALRALQDNENCFFQIFIRSDSERTHSWEWERLIPPDTQKPLSLLKRVEFFRLLQTPVSRQPSSKVFSRPAVFSVIASDKHLLSSYNMYPIQIDAQQQIFTKLFKEKNDLPYYIMSEDSQPVTLSRITKKLKTGRFNILHVLAHGISTPSSSEPYLAILSTANPNTPLPTTRTDLREQFAKVEKQNMPKITILNTCYSSESSIKWPFDNMAKPFLEAGVSNVIAFQNRVKISETEAFQDAFYKELTNGTGRVASAVTAGRRALYYQFGENWPSPEHPVWTLPVLYAKSEVNVVQFSSKDRENEIQEKLRTNRERIEYRSRHYIENQVTQPEIEGMLSEELLLRVNRPSPRHNYLILHSKLEYGRTTTLYRLMYRQLHFLEAGTVEMWPLYVDLRECENSEISDNIDWPRFFERKILDFYGADVVNSNVKASRKVFLLDNVGELPPDVIRKLHTWLVGSREHFFVITSLTHQLSKLLYFQIENLSIELCGLPSLDTLPQENKLRRYLKDEKIKAMAQSPKVRVEFEEITKKLEYRDHSSFARELLQAWLHKRFTHSEIGIKRLLEAAELISYEYSIDTIETENQRSLEAYLSDRGFASEVSIITEFIKQNILEQDSQHEPDRFRFTYPIVQSFLTASYLKNNLKSKSTLSLYEFCNTDDEFQHKVLEFLVAMLAESERRVISEGIIFDALRASQPFLAARLVNQTRQHNLKPNVTNLIFMSLLEQFALGDKKQREEFVRWMKIDSVILDTLDKNSFKFTIECKDEAIEYILELLFNNNQNTIDDVLILYILNWIVGSQSIPILFSLPIRTRQTPLYDQVLGRHKDWLNSLIPWIKENDFSSAEVQKIQAQLKNMVDRKNLSQEVFSMLNKLLSSN
jgi:hypothetical protein